MADLKNFIDEVNAASDAGLGSVLSSWRPRFANKDLSLSVITDLVSPMLNDIRPAVSLSLQLGSRSDLPQSTRVLAIQTASDILRFCVGAYDLFQAEDWIEIVKSELIPHLLVGSVQDSTVYTEFVRFYRWTVSFSGVYSSKLTENQVLATIVRSSFSFQRSGLL